MSDDTYHLAQLRAVLNTAVDCIITIDDCGIIESFNPAGERTFGYTADEVIGQNVSILMPPPYCDEHDRYIKKYLDTGAAKIIGIGREITARRKDGIDFSADIAVSEVKLPNRRLFTGIIRDITDRKRTEERLLQSERLAAIGQAITGLSHESRNAFQRSQACLEMLAIELEDRPDELELVNRIQRALDHVHHLYEEVRDYAAPVQLDRQTCSVDHVWREAWSHLRLMCEGKKIELCEETSGLNLSCDVDWFTMGQVFRNVLENAIDACPDPGRIAIHCSEGTLGDTPALVVCVRDNGPGFDLESSQNVFDPFFTTKTKGTGLGMAIASRIVESHGGRITVSRSTSGAEVSITLPR